MKKFLTILILASVTYSCQKDVEASKDIIPKNHLQSFSKIQNQTFSLDLAIDTVITGSKGTLIRFKREDFEISEEDTVTLVLREIYDFNELLFNNIQTVTDKGELLESSGVIFYEFKNGDESLQLKDDAAVQVIFPDNRLKGNDIFYGSRDSLNQMTWELANPKVSIALLDTANIRKYRVDMYESKVIPLDSLEYYQQLQQDLEEARDNMVFDNTTSTTDWTPVFLKEMGWINIDRFVNPDDFVDFELEVDKKTEDGYSLYFLYEDMDTFMMQYRTAGDDLSFSEIPRKGKSYLLIVTEDENGTFADKIEITGEPVLKANLNKVTLSELEELATE